MSDIISPFKWVAAYRVVICIECQYGCAAGEAEAHLRGTNHRMTVGRAREITKAVQALPGIFQDQFDLRQFQFPPPSIAEIPFLRPAQRDGLGCERCAFVCRGEQWMRDHCRTQHQWDNPRKRGRPSAGQEKPDMPWRVNVQCQQFFPNRQASSWFEVNRRITHTSTAAFTISEKEEAAAAAAPPPPPPLLPPRRTNQQQVESVAQMVARRSEHKIRQLQKARRNIIEVADDRLETNLWLQRTGWAVHLRGLSRSRLMRSLEPIRDDEPALRQMWQSFQRAAAQGRAWSTRAKVSVTVLFEANRKDGDARPNKPFNSRMERQTWERYSEVMRRVICYVHRSETWDDADRPPYKMTTRQGDAWDAFTEKAAEMAEDRGAADDAEEQARLDRMCIDAVIGLVDHELKVTEYENVLISALAVMGLSADDGWLPAFRYTGKFAAVMKMMRIFMVMQAVHEHEEEMAALAEGGADEFAAYDQCQGLIRRVRQKAYRFMVHSSRQTPCTPMGWIYNTKAYGMTIQNTSKAEGDVAWSGTRITYKKIQFTMSDLCDMVHGVIAEARQTMAQLLMMMPEGGHGGHEAFPAIDWEKLHDDHSDDTKGYGFLHDSRNVWPVDGQRWLMAKITQEAPWQQRWIARPGSRSPFRARQVQRYGKWLDEFREQLLVLMHMTGGQPARGTEILGVRFANTGGGGIRNVFVHNGMVSFVVLYHKNIRTSERAKTIARYVPREVGSLLVWYLWLVLPFWQQIAGWHEDVEASAFLWARDVVYPSETARSTRDRSERGESMGKGGGSEEEEEEEGEGEEEEKEGEGAGEEPNRDAIVAPGRGEWSTAKVDGVWTSERLRRRLRRYTEQHMGTAIDIISWRNIVVAISRRYLEGIFRSDELSEEDEEDGEDDGNQHAGYSNEHEDEDIAAAQTGHTRRTRANIYGVEIGRSEFGTESRRDQFRHYSTRWHAFLGLTDRAEGGTRLGKRKREAWEASAEEARRRRFKKLRQVNIHGQLEQMIGPGAAFRGCQEQVMQAIFRGSTPIVQVTGTGGGKSLSFMLPAYCAGAEGSTIVIVPMVSLQQDLVRRCEASGIEVCQWSSRGTNRAAAIVLVTPESASTKMFRGFVNRLQARQQLDRVVIDECHMALDAGDAFRPELRALGRTVGQWGAQMVLLTATMPPREEAAFFEVMGMQAERVTMFRVPTTRRNIRYRVRHTRAEEQESTEEAVQAEVEAIQRREGQRARMIIYGNTIQRTEAIGDLIHCPVYHSAAAGVQGKQRIIKDWMRDGGAIAATNALGVGLDVADVRAVIHAGSPRRLRDYAQESGRAGRDGQASEAVIVCPRIGDPTKGRRGGQRRQTAGTGTMRESKGREEDEEDIRRFVRGEECRRLVLDEVMDGRMERTGCEEGEEECDVCEKERQLRDESQGHGQGEEQGQEEEEEEYEMMGRRTGWMAAEEPRRRREEMREMAMFRADLEDWADACVACRLRLRREFRHEAEECPETEDDFTEHVEAGAQWVKSRMREKDGEMAKYSGCYECRLPQSICDRWETEEEDEGRFRARKEGRCQHGLFVYRIIAGCFERYSTWTSEIFQQEYGREREWTGTVEEAVEVMKLKRRWGGEETNEGCRFVYRIMEKWKGVEIGDDETEGEEDER